MRKVIFFIFKSATPEPGMVRGEPRNGTGLLFPVMAQVTAQGDCYA